MVDLYLARSTFAKDRIIDDYESLIWTERYQGYGDFKLVVKEDHWLTGNPLDYKYLRLSESNRIMMLETESKAKERDGINVVEITGKSFEGFLATRSCKTITSEPLVYYHNPSVIATAVVKRYCIDSTTTAQHNVIPGLTAPPRDEDVGRDDWVNVTIERGDIYTITQQLCQTFNLGFKIEYAAPGVLEFRVYRGDDYSKPDQANYTEYSVNNESLLSSSSLKSIANFKNNARVIGFKDIVDVFTPGTPDTVGGMDRRTVVVEARDIGAEDDPTTREEQLAALTVRGRQALADVNNRYINMADGELRPDVVMDAKLELGNIVAVKSLDGTRTKMIISERIWSVDSQGLKRIPTFQQLLEN